MDITVQYSWYGLFREWNQPETADIKTESNEFKAWSSKWNWWEWNVKGKIHKIFYVLPIFGEFDPIGSVKKISRPREYCRDGFFYMDGRVITKLSIQKRNPGRVNVYLDGKFAFGIPKDAAAGLKTGQELTENEIEKL